MQEYFELRDQLAGAYPNLTDWQRVAHDSHVDARTIVFAHVNATTAWANILAAVKTQERMTQFRNILERENRLLLPTFDIYATWLTTRRVSNVQISRSNKRETDSDDAITQFCWDVA